MTTAVSSAALATIQPVFTEAERVALAGFLAGYRGLTREAYALDLRQFTSWCRARSLSMFAARRADIEGFARDLEARGRARATVTRRLSTIAGFYKYAVEEELHTSAMWRRRYRLVQTWAICTPAQFTGDGPSRVMPMVIGVSRHVAKRSRAGQRVLNAWPDLDRLPKPCKRLPSTGSPPP